MLLLLSVTFQIESFGRDGEPLAALSNDLGFSGSIPKWPFLPLRVTLSFLSPGEIAGISTIIRSSKRIMSSFCANAFFPATERGMRGQRDESQSPALRTRM